MTTEDACWWVFDLVIMYGGQLSTAYICAHLFAQFLEQRKEKATTKP